MSFGAGAVKSHSAKIGTCPHGLPLGACPICNGMAGGNSTTKRDIPRNVGEMSYNQCAAIGAMLRAQKLARSQVQQAHIAREEYLRNFVKNIANVHKILSELSARIDRFLPRIISLPANFAINLIQKVILVPIQAIFTGITNFSQKFVDITDKLTAVFGELKAAIGEKISKFATNFKKKLKSLFFIFSSSEADDEEKKIEEAKRVFELKTFLNKLLRREVKEDEH